MKRGIISNAVDWRSRKLQGKITYQGLPISIENGRGTYRQGTDEHGKVWRSFMHIPYGYIRSTEGTDGDHVDVYVGPAPDSTQVYIVHQNDPYTGRYDEDKCMVGFRTAADAKAAYLRQYDRPDYFGSMTEVDMATFKQMLKDRKGVKLKKSRSRQNLVPVERQVMRRGKVFTMRFWVSKQEAEQIRESRQTVPMGKEKRQLFDRKRRDSVKFMEEAIRYSPKLTRQIDRSMKLQHTMFPEGPGTGAETSTILKTAETELRYIIAQEAKGEYFGRDWYTNKMVKTRGTLAMLHPELVDDDQWALLSSLIAITSPGLKPDMNLELSLGLYQAYKDTGTIPTLKPDGTKWPGTDSEKSIAQFNTNAQKLGGIPELVQWMQQDSTGAEIKDIFPKFTGKVGTEYPHSRVFGPKVGVFFRNLLGESQHLTIDRWAARSFYRWSNKIKPFFNSQKRWEANVVMTEGEKDEMKYIIGTLADEYNMTVSEMQAVFWYYEKRLYRTLGSTDEVEGIDYAEAAEQAYERHLSSADGGNSLPSTA